MPPIKFGLIDHRRSVSDFPAGVKVREPARVKNQAMRDNRVVVAGKVVGSNPHIFLTANNAKVLRSFLSQLLTGKSMDPALKRKDVFEYCFAAFFDFVGHGSIRLINLAETDRLFTQILLNDQGLQVEFAFGSSVPGQFQRFTEAGLVFSVNFDRRTNVRRSKAQVLADFSRRLCQFRFET